MNFNILKKWVLNRIEVNSRLQNTLVSHLFFLMVSTRKHSLQGAAKFSGVNKSQFSRLLKDHTDVAVYNLDKLSKRQAKQFSKILKCLEKGSLPWNIAIVIDSTIQKRSSLHTENAQRFNHGKGFVIGHQWTNIVLIINDLIIPLPPIPFYTKKYCHKNNLKYKTEHELVIEYINNLMLEDYIGKHNPKEVIVLADSGYDDHNIEKAIIKKKWQFIIALGKTRGVKSEKVNSDTPKSKGWSHVAVFFKKNRRIGWQTIRVPTNSTKRKRMEFRIRQTIGYLRRVGRVQLICSKFKKRPKGRIKYLACNDLKALARQILIGYRIRWKIEIFHKEVKMYLGFEDVSTKFFVSVMAHVHWVYCAYILLHFHPPGLPAHMKSIVEKQRKMKQIIESREISHVFQLLSQIKGVERYKNKLRRALEASCGLKPLLIKE